MRAVGVYNAEGSLRGELSYVLKKLSGRGSCSLCDITSLGLLSMAALSHPPLTTFECYMRPPPDPLGIDTYTAEELTL